MVLRGLATQPITRHITSDVCLPDHLKGTYNLSCVRDISIISGFMKSSAVASTCLES